MNARQVHLPRWGRWAARAVLWGLLLASFGCDQRATLNFASGPLEFTVGASELSLPDEFRTTESPSQVRSIPCDMTPCPAASGFAVSCVTSMCNPDPVMVQVPVTSIDVDALTRELPKAFPEADMYAIREVTYSIPLNTLNVDVGEVRLLWAPEGAPNGMTVLATVPPLPSRANRNGTATINVAGETALSDFLANTSPRVQLFAETELDVDPGAAFPEGELQVVAEVALTASGPVL